MPADVFRRIVKEAPFHDEGHGFDVFGLHPPYLATVVNATAAVYEDYFRVDSAGAEHIPAHGPAIVIANHSGMLPVDGAMLCVDVLRRTNPPRIPRAIADHFVPRFPLISAMFARLGVVNGTRANVNHLLQRDELVAIWPEGVSGVAKLFRDRYRIQKWSVGFAELAIRYRAPIVPAAIVGAEESWPVLARFRSLHPFGAPYLPIPASPIPLPTHYHIRYGEPLGSDRDPGDADVPRIVHAVADEARRAIERLIERTLAERHGVFL